MRLPLSTLEVFDAIAREGSLRAAAVRLGLQPSTVSHQLKALERELGVTLFARTTRSISLTTAGEALYRGSHPAIDQIAGALQSARDAGGSRRGSLRITMPGFAYDLVVGSKLRSFREAYPEVELEINITETFVDLFEERFHAGIRLGDRIDPEMIAVRLTPPIGVAVLASATYLERAGCPATPEELASHECIRYRFARSRRFAPWHFAGAEGRYSVEVSGHLIVNTLPSLFSAVQAGLGLGYSFSDYRPPGSEDVVSILEEFTEPIGGAYLYYPREYRTVELLRLFIDHLR